MIKHHSHQISRTAHFYTLGTLSSKTEYIWLVCHGYGQAADRFIRKFDQLDLNKHFIIAPEGLSRFYWGGVDGPIVASWMTRKDRLDEIDDHTTFIDSVKATFDSEDHQAKWIMMGFSQGCATVVRYMNLHRPVFSQLVLWAGSFPHDINYERFSSYLNAGDVHMIIGNEDEYISDELLNTEKQFILDHNLKVNLRLFEGTHRVDRDVLSDYCDSLDHFV